MANSTPTCIVCGLDDQHAPLLSFNYQGAQQHICPQHLPILIHKPAQLAGKLPGMEQLGPPEGH